MQIIANRPNANILVLIDNGTGLEMLPSFDNLIWVRGVLDSAWAVTDENHRRQMFSSADENFQKKQEAEIQKAIDTTKGKTN